MRGLGAGATPQDGADCGRRGCQEKRGSVLYDDLTPEKYAIEKLVFLT